MDVFSQAEEMHGWQWMFIIEALPAVILDFVILSFLSNGIDDAKWLSESEKQPLAA